MRDGEGRGWTVAQRTIRLTDDEQRVLELALEFYVRLGLGQFSEIAQRVDLIHGARLTPDQKHNVRQLCNELEDVLWASQAPWQLGDNDTSLHTLVAFGLDARLARNPKGQRWAQRRIKKRAEVEQIDYRET